MLNNITKSEEYVVNSIIKDKTISDRILKFINGSDKDYLTHLICTSTISISSKYKYLQILSSYEKYHRSKEYALSINSEINKINKILENKDLIFLLTIINGNCQICNTFIFRNWTEIMNKLSEYYANLINVYFTVDISTMENVSNIVYSLYGHNNCNNSQPTIYNINKIASNSIFESIFSKIDSMNKINISDIIHDGEICNFIINEYNIYGLIHIDSDYEYIYTIYESTDISDMRKYDDIYKESLITYENYCYNNDMIYRYVIQNLKICKNIDNMQCKTLFCIKNNNLYSKIDNKIKAYKLEDLL